MFCENCGKQLAEGVKFCDACGKRVIIPEENNATQSADNQAPEIIQNSLGQNSMETEQVISEQVESDDFAPAKKTRKWVRPAVIVAIILILSFGIVYAAPVIKNTVQKLYYSPEDYFKVVFKREIKQTTDEIGTLATSIDLDSVFENNASQVDLKLEIGEEVGSLANLSWLKNLSLSLNSATADGNISAGGLIKLNDKDIAGVNIAVEDETIYLELPELSKRAIKFNINDFINTNDYYNTEVYSFNDLINSSEYKTLKKVVDALPDQKFVQNLLYRYICCLADQINAVEETSDDVEAGTLKQSATKLTVTLDENLAKKCAIAVLNQLKTDSEFKSAFKKICDIKELNLDFDNEYAKFEEAIDEALSELENVSSNSAGPSIKLNMWVNNIGDIVGWGVSVDQASFSEIYLKSRIGNKFGYAINASAGFAQTVTFEGDGTISDDKQNGTFYLKAAGQKLLKATVKDLDTQAFYAGNFEGSITFEIDGLLKNQLKALPINNIPSEARALVENISDLKLKIESKDKSKNCSSGKLSLYKGSELYAALSVDTNIEKANGINIPANCSDIKTERELQKWANTVNINNIWQNLSSAGMPRSIVNDIKRELMY